MKVINNAKWLDDDVEKIGEFIAPFVKKWIDEDNKIMEHYYLDDSYYGKTVTKAIIDMRKNNV